MAKKRQEDSESELDDQRDSDSSAEDETEASEEDSESEEETDSEDSDSDEDDRARKGEHEDEDEDAAAARVAKSLGVGDDDDDDKDKDVPKNRALRRREEAAERRRKRKAKADAIDVDADEDDDLPKDRNKRAKELLKKRRKEAEAEPVAGLTAGEMVEDSLARGTAAANRWFRENFKLIGYGILAAAAITGGLVYYYGQEEAQMGAASGDLFSGVASDLGQVAEEDKRTDDEKKYDPTKYYKTDVERADASIASFNKVIDAHPDTGPAILAKLGRAGAHLDKGEYKPAVDAYNEVAATTLAGADNAVKARALEGAGYALEGSGDIDGAMAKFKEIDGLGTGMTELSKYHQARLLIAKGENDKAKELLVETKKKLDVPTKDGAPMKYLKAVVDETLRALDPTAAPAKPTLGGPKGGSLSPEELQKLMEDAKRRAEKREETPG